MATYLLATVVADLAHVETGYQSISGRNVSLKLWAQSHKLDKLKLSLQLLPKVLYAIEQYVGFPYSLPKLDIIAVPGYDSARAMENWGLIVQRYILSVPVLKYGY